MPQGPGPNAVQFNGNWYEAVESGQTWPAAARTATERGGHLVHIDDKAENDFIRDTFAEPQPVWIGMKDTNANGIWTLTDGTRATYEFWRVGQPDNLGGNQFYARMAYPGGRWDDGARDTATWYNGTRFVEAEPLTVVEFEG